MLTFYPKILNFFWKFCFLLKKIYFILKFLTILS